MLLNKKDCHSGMKGLRGKQPFAIRMPDPQEREANPGPGIKESGFRTLVSVICRQRTVDSDQESGVGFLSAGIKDSDVEIRKAVIPAVYRPR
ncbi:MAG: hypothetical protein ACRERV_04140 [Methylococcales bacterium]